MKGKRPVLKKEATPTDEEADEPKGPALNEGVHHDENPEEVTRELKGFEHGQQLIDTTNFDLDALPWSNGIESPDAKRLHLGTTTLPAPDMFGDVVKTDEEVEGMAETEKENPNDSNAIAPVRDNIIMLPAALGRGVGFSDTASHFRALCHDENSKGQSRSSMESNDVVSDREVVEREAGITFSQLPLAMDKALGIIVRSELQALGIFRAIDADNDQVIMLSDAREMLTDPTDPETDADENAARMVAADLYLNKVCDVIDSRGASIRSLYSELERMAASTSPGGISKDDFIHFVRGWCPSDVARTIGHKQQESILRAVDCNADDTIGWEEFKKHLYPAMAGGSLNSGRNVSEPRRLAFQLMQQLYKDNVAKLEGSSRQWRAHSAGNRR